MPKHLDVFISSTSIDLPEHREAVVDALLAIGLFPSGMEHWPTPADKNPVDFCYQKMQEAEIFIGIYAHRYGWRPDGSGSPSITEMEYDWAGELGIPRFCFIMDDDHPWPRSRMELDAQEELTAFKARVSENVRGTFTTPDDLAKQVLAALAPYAQKQNLSGLSPYLRHLHHEALQSGLLRTLNARTSDLTARGETVTVDQVYTPLDTRLAVPRADDGRVLWEAMEHTDREAIRAETRDNDTRPLSAMEAANHYERLVLLGDPGSGKSTFVKFLTLGLSGYLLDRRSDWLERLREQGWEHEALFPVQVTLREFAQDMGEPHEIGTAQSILGHLRRQLEQYGCGEEIDALQAAMRNGDVLLMLDGLDEVPSDKREAVRDAVADLMAAYPCRVLITCRILSYATPEWQIPGTDTVTLAPFDKDKIAHFIQAWYRAAEALGGISHELARARVADLTEAAQDPRLRDMATNPMLLTVMAIVHNHQGTLPEQTAKLYWECVEILMLRWRPENARHLREVLGFSNELDLHRILWHVAFYAHDTQGDKQGTADLRRGELLELVAEDHLQGNYALAQQFCDYVEEHAGLLIGRGGADDRGRVYAFPHRTFQEFLAGCHITDDMNYLDLFGEKARAGANWRQVLLLATGHWLFNRMDNNAPLLVAQELLTAEPHTVEDWRAVWLAGEMLLLMDLTMLQQRNVGRRVLEDARRRLVELIEQGALEPVERAAVGRVLAELGDPRPGVGVDDDGLPDIDWVEIPAGPFLMGSDKDKDPQAYDDEMPQHTVELPTFYISRYPITYAQFRAFVDDPQGFRDARWWEGLALPEDHNAAPGDQAFKFANHPRERVSWYDAVAFCRWLSWRLGGGWDLDAVDEWAVRLPTEAEWEKAARGTDGRVYPYGDAFDPNKGNTYETGIGRTSAVGLFPDGASPYGVLDMSGNVWEWCMTKWRGDYGKPEDNDPAGDARRVVRGGSWDYLQIDARAAYRSWVYPDYRIYNVGFRVVRPPSLKEH